MHPVRPLAFVMMIQPDRTGRIWVLGPSGANGNVSGSTPQQMYIQNTFG